MVSGNLPEGLRGVVIKFSKSGLHVYSLVDEQCKRIVRTRVVNTCPKHT